MNNLINYITTLEVIEPFRHYISVEKDFSTVYLNGEWWVEFSTYHNLKVSNMLLRYIHYKFHVNYLYIYFDDLESTCRNRLLAWNENTQMYLA